LGFTSATGHETGHRWFELKEAELPPIRTKVSQGRTPIPPLIEAKISKQLRVRHPFFIDVVSCTKSRSEYLEQVRHDPYPPFDKIIV
jgi:hypothetical protein